MFNCSLKHHLLSMPRIIKGSQKVKAKPKASEVSIQDQLSRIHALESGVLESRTNLNNVAELLTMCSEHSENFRLAVAATTALRRVLVKLAKQHEFQLSKSTKTSTNQAEAAKLQVESWLLEKYRAFQLFLLAMFKNSDERLQISALNILMDFVALECELRATAAENHDRTAFFTDLYWSVLLHSLSSQPSTLLQNELVNFVNHNDDLRFYACKAIKHFTSRAWNDVAADLSAEAAKVSSDAYNCFCTNCVDLLLKMNVPATRDSSAAKFWSNPEAAELTASPSTPNALRRGASAQLPQQRRQKAEAWLSLLNMRLPLGVYKTVLLEIPTKIMSCLAAASEQADKGGESKSSAVSPLKLADFLTDSYRMGGVISLLSLNGLFLLMQEYNLDYPNFYPQLYQLLQPEVFHAKYKQRFFRLLDLFLTSNYMPVTMIAAFAKRMSRLSLTAPPSGCLFISAVVFNLIRRHPTLLPLIHQTNKRKRDDDESEQPATKVQNIGDDVFDMSQTDPTKARAMESSLWELKTLQNHYIWAVASQAKLFEAENAPKSDMDVEPLVEKSYHSLMQEEIERKADAKPALAVHKPTSLIGASFDAWGI